MLIMWEKIGLSERRGLEYPTLNNWKEKKIYINMNGLTI